MPSFKRLFKGDYDSEEQGLIDKLSSSLNYGIEVLYDALNRKLTLRDNISCTVKDVEVTVNSSGIPNSSTTFSMDITNKIDGLMVIRAENLTNSNTYPSGGVFVTFSQNNTTVTIIHVTGLQANNNYRLRIVAFGQ